MKPFDLEKAKAGAKVCTRDGREARIVCFDVNEPQYPILALTTNNDNTESVSAYTKDGFLWSDKQKSDYDLMMVGEKKEGWINILRDPEDQYLFTNEDIYSSKEEAEKDPNLAFKPIATIKIEWEE